MEHFNIAIDGPAGAGKSTIAKLAAKRLGFVYVDTGAMYRTIAVSYTHLDVYKRQHKSPSAGSL